MNIDLSEAKNPCQPDEHDWEYEEGDSSVGINDGWICKSCGATNDEPAPDKDWDEPFIPL